MRKRMIAIAMAVAVITSCSACGNKAESVNTDKSKKPVASVDVKQTTAEKISDETTSDEVISEEITTKENASETEVSETETTEVRATDAASGTSQKTSSVNSDTKADSSVNTPKAERQTSGTASTKSDNTSKGNSSVNTATNKTTVSTGSNKSDNSTNSTTKPAPVNTNKPAETKQPATTKQPETTKAPVPAHTHSYTSAVTIQATCNTAGVKTYTCSCGNAYTESIPATGSHSWEHHDAVSHTETVMVKEAYDETITTGAYVCLGCNKAFTSEEYGSNDAALDAWTIHSWDTAWNDPSSNCTGYTTKDNVIINTIHHPAVTENRTVIDTPAYDICVTCGTKK